LGDALPKTQQYCLFEQSKYGIEYIQVGIFLIALLDECLDELEYAGEVELLLFFLLSLEGAFGAVDVLPAYDASFLALVAVPPADVLDGLDGGELAVVDVDVVGDAHEWFVDIGDGVDLHAGGLETGLVDLPDLLVELGDLGVEEDDGNHLQGDEGGHVLNGVVVLVHADVRQQVHEVQKIVPFRSPVLEVLGDGTEVLLVEGDLHPLCFYLAEGVLGVLHFLLLCFDLESVAILVVLVLEELLQDEVLILF
jgi:hypothetical protein